MAKLHELLATSSSTDTQAAKVIADLTNTFQKKSHLFGEKIVTTTPIDAENGAVQTEIQSTAQTTVSGELKWVSDIIAKAMDVDFQIDMANTQAQADIVLENGTIIASGVPATALLQLEKSLKKVQDLATAIPTLDPAKGFTPDTQKGSGYFIARAVRKVKTKKVNTPIVLYPATPEHPAQVQLASTDIDVANVEENEWSSLLTPAQKAEIIDRTDQIIRAVKRSRARANQQDIDTTVNKIGAKLLSFVFEGSK